FLLSRRPPTSTSPLFPYTTLFRSAALLRSLYFLPSVTSVVAVSLLWTWLYNPEFGWINALLARLGIPGPAWLQDPGTVKPALIVDRKSTRLNSSHVAISYAVFCLK